MFCRSTSTAHRADPASRQKEKYKSSITPHPECSRKAKDPPCHTRQRLHVHTEIARVTEKAEQPMAFLRRKQGISHLIEPRAQHRALLGCGRGTQVMRKIL